MQNDHSNKKSAGFWSGKAYYIVLGLCAVAIAVAGYVFVSDAVTEKRALEASLSAPVTATVPEQSKTERKSELPAGQEVQAAAEAEQEEARQPVSQTVEETVMPVSGAVQQDHVMDRLVYNTTTRDWRVHNGVDLSGPLGQPVQAARGGTVTAVYEDDSYGITVVVQHEGGWSSHYCGLAEQPAVKAGDAVTVGQTLGVIGNTAMVEAAQEPHLHFEVYRNGEPADPAGFLY